jgi:hypothetical protein
MIVEILKNYTSVVVVVVVVVKEESKIFSS